MRSFTGAWLSLKLPVFFILYFSSALHAQESREVVDSQSDLSDCIFIVNIEEATHAEQLAASVAVGLVNRRFDKPTAAALNGPNDWKWINDIRHGHELKHHRWVKTSLVDFLTYSVAIGAVTKVIEYQPSESWALANVVTLAGVENAVPIPANIQPSLFGNVDTSGSEQGPHSIDLQSEYSMQLVDIDEAPPRGPRMGWGSIDTHLGLDALGSNQSEGVYVFSGLEGLPRLATSRQWHDELDATLWAWFNLYPKCNQTDELIVIQRPEALEKGFLADFTAMKQLFVFFLPVMCKPGAQQLLFDAMTEAAYYNGNQLTVMGYSIEDEVVADCSPHHTEISLVSDWCPNLSFYSKMQPLSARLTQVPLGDEIIYKSSDIYLAVINSDGDNLQMENNGNRDGMESRVQLCAQPGNVCPPLAWTISNHLTTVAPFQLQWYYDQAQKTGRDTFLMGPTGYGFLHPSAIASNETMLASFVDSTVEAAEQLGMTGSMANVKPFSESSPGKDEEREQAIRTSRTGQWQIDDSPPIGSLIDAKGQTQSTQASQMGLSEQPGTLSAEQKQHNQQTEVSHRGRKLHMQVSDLESMDESLDDRPRSRSVDSWLTSGASSSEEYSTANFMRVVPASRMTLDAAQNSAARELYLQRFNGTAVNTVFAPGEYHIPNWIGDLAAIPELFRWGKEDPNITNIVERFNTMPQGTIGYIYKIFEVNMSWYEQVAQKIASNVHLVDHRQLHSLALQKKEQGL